MAAKPGAASQRETWSPLDSLLLKTVRLYSLLGVATKLQHSPATDVYQKAERKKNKYKKSNILEKPMI